MLLDEAGAGTDPLEGGALAMAIIDHFRRRGAMVVATTHYDALKSYASTTEGVMAAGFGFDPQTFAPTYRLNYGSPGSSLALEIANRLGMPGRRHRAGARASERRGRPSSPSISRRSSATCRRSITSGGWPRASARRSQETRPEAAGARAGAAQPGGDVPQAARERIEERLRDARREIDAVVDALKAPDATHGRGGRAARGPPDPTGDTGAARAEAPGALERSRSGCARRRRPRSRPPRIEPGRARAVGDRVPSAPFGLEGVVQALHDREAEVDVRGKRLRARVDELRVLVAPAGVAAHRRGCG